MGKVYKRKNSPYYWIAYTAHGRRIRESSKSRSKGIAEKLLRQKEARAVLGPGHLPGSKKAFRDFMTEYLEWIKATRRQHTYRSYSSILKTLQAYLEDKQKIIRLKDIDLKTLEDYKRYRLTVSKTNTVKNHIICIKAFFNTAVEWSYLAKNPAQYLKPVEITDAKPIRFLTEEEYRTFMKVCKEKFPQYYPMFYTFLHTGMRSSELLSLEWEDIDLDNGYIYLGSKEGFKPKGINRKTGKAKERVIPIHAGVIDVIRTLPNRQRRVFDQHRRPRRLLIRIAREAGINGLTRLHELRHSYASFLLKKGVDIYKIKELLGHSDIRDTMKYTHLPTIYMKEDVDLLKELD